MVVAVVDVGVLGRDLVERALPQVAGEGEHVRLVHEREVLAGAAASELEGVADAPLDTMRVLTEPWVAISCGVPLRRNPPSPT